VTVFTPVFDGLLKGVHARLQRAMHARERGVALNPATELLSRLMKDRRCGA
jgi:hypothetical protein